MFRPTRLHHRFLAVVGALAMLTIAAPVAANTPQRITETDTSLVCDSVTGDAGTIRVRASLSSTGGPTGFLNYWTAGTDPAVEQPTLVSQGVDVIIGTDGSITATFQMFTPGDLGLEGEAEPIFVGISELMALVSPTGEVEEIVEREQNGNHRFVALGGRQALMVTDGEAVVPTAGAFDLTGSVCEGRQQVVHMFTTQPDALVSNQHLIHLVCVVETANGLVSVGAQGSLNDTVLFLDIVDGTESYFGFTTAADISTHGVSGRVEAPMVGDPSVVAIADVSTRFSVIDRFKFRIPEGSGWIMQTYYLYSVSGTISVDAPGFSLDVPMENCLAAAAVRMDYAH
jgi:hypothetical protein